VRDDRVAVASAGSYAYLVLLGRIAVLLTSMRPVVTDRVAWSVGLSLGHTSEPCKNGCTDQDAVWVGDSGGPKEPCIRWGADPPMGRGNFEGGKGSPIVKYRDTL